MEKVAHLMVQIAYSEYSRLRALGDFSLNVLAFIGFVVLLPVFIFILVAYFVILAVISGAFFSTIISHVFNSL
jgi:hypothetical protein